MIKITGYPLVGKRVHLKAWPDIKGRVVEQSEEMCVVLFDGEVRGFMGTLMWYETDSICEEESDD